MFRAYASSGTGPSRNVRGRVSLRLLLETIAVTTSRLVVAGTHGESLQN